MSHVTVADVVRHYSDALREDRGGWLPYPVERALRDMGRCRTAALGGHLYACGSCASEVPLYNSCQNRHCPQCQSRAKERWLEARMEDLLPVQYFHVVFMVPSELRTFFRADPRRLYDILFRASWETLKRLAADPKRLGAEPGALAVLHTWNQQLLLHPHIHMVVPGGGFDACGRWTSSKPRFLFHVKPLAKLFAGRFLHHLERGVRHGDIRLPAAMERSPSLFKTTLDSLLSKRWVVYAKRPFDGPEKVLRYLARYTHRVAIGNSRLVSLDDDHVTFLYKRRSSEPEWKTREIQAVEFLRRFTLHVLPPAFVRIRYFGFLSNRKRRAAVAACREQLGNHEVEEAADNARRCRQTRPSCPHCKQGQLLEIQAIPRKIVSNPRAPP